MKKYFYYLFALSALVMFTSCLSDKDEPERKLSFTTPINCQAINDNDVVFTLGTSKVDMDFTQSLINFTFDYKDADGKTHSLVTPQMKMTAVNSTAYQFTAAGQGNGGAESLSGYLDMPNLILWYTFNDGSTKMVCTSQLLYAYTNTTITNPDNGNNGNHYGWYKKNHIKDGNYDYILFGSSYDGGSNIDNGCPLPNGYDDIGETDSSLNVLRGNALIQEFEISATNCTDYPTNNKLDARQVWHAMVTFEEDLPTFADGYGNVEVCGLYWDIKDIIVMAADSDGNLMDLAHIEGNDDTCFLYETDTLTTSTVSFQTNLLNIDGWPLVWAVAKDPRVNHANTDWVWSKNYPTLGSSDLKPTGVETGVENHFGNWDGYNTSLNEGFVKSVSANMSKNLRAYALANIQYVCKNLTLSNAKDLEPNLNLKLVSGSDKTTNTFSTAFIPNHPFTSLWQLGAVSRGVPGQTVNLKKYGGPEGGLKYEDGDAWLLDYFKLNEVSPDQPFPGKFNPNCFNALSYRYLLANIPVNVDLVPADSTSPVDEDNPDPAWVYQPGRLDIDDVARTRFHYDWIDAAPDTQVIDLENQLFIFTADLDFEQHQNDEYIAPKQAEKQSWSPVEAFYNFVQIRNAPTYRVATVQADGTLSSWGAQQKANDRLAESLIGCTAGLLSTRYEYFTVFAIGQSVKYIGQTHTNSRDDYLPLVPVKPEATYVSGNPGKDFYNQLVNPVKIKVSDTEEGWYSILATQMRLMTIERDCWFNTMKVVRTQLY